MVSNKSNGFSSTSDEMMTAFSIMQTMTIAPFQNIIINALDTALSKGGYDDAQLYFDQLTPLAILANQAKDSGTTIDQVADQTNKELEKESNAQKRFQLKKRLEFLEQTQKRAKGIAGSKFIENLILKKDSLGRPFFSDYLEKLNALEDLQNKNIYDQIDLIINIYMNIQIEQIYQNQKNIFKSNTI